MGATLIASASRMMMSASLPGVSEPVLPSSLKCLAPLMVAKRSTSRALRSGGTSAGYGGSGHWLLEGGGGVPRPQKPWFTPLRCLGTADPLWVEDTAP